MRNRWSTIDATLPRSNWIDAAFEDIAVRFFTWLVRHDETDKLDFAISGVVSGKYIVRVQVDGAESSLDVDTNPLSPTFNQYTGTPQVTIP